MNNHCMLMLLCLLTASACSKQMTEKAVIKRSAIGSGSNLTLALTDAPNPSVKQVFVNVDRVEVQISQSNRSIILTGAESIGQIDLLTLQNGIILPLAGFPITAGTIVQQIRFILKPLGNYLTKEDGSACLLKTPSQQQSGLKMIMPIKISIEANKNYRIVIDFDALKSIVFPGDDGCLLKPVIKIKSLETLALDQSVTTASGDSVVTAPATTTEDAPVASPPGPVSADNSNTDTQDTTIAADDSTTWSNDYNAEELAAILAQ